MVLVTGAAALVVAACVFGDPPTEEQVQIAGTDVQFTMVRIPGGTYEMPNPADPTDTLKVEIKDFWIEKTETTWDEYDVFMYRLDEPEADRLGDPKDGISRPTKPYGAADRGFGHEGYPAIGITYRAGTDYCRWLSVKTGHKYRLPTEAEWEYACRAGALARGPITDQAWLEAHTWNRGNSPDKTQPVGKKEPNAWGLYDMLGNASEWCRAQDMGAVARGGSFVDQAEKVNCEARERQTEAWNASDPQLPKSKWWLTDAPFVGYRVVREDG
jgi:formylglycine-generating enzyme required for sulfatase activity